MIRWARDAAAARDRRHRARHGLVKQLADHVFVLHNGTPARRGRRREIRANPRVQAVYVGAARNERAPRLAFEGVTGGYGTSVGGARRERRGGAGRGAVRARPQRRRQEHAAEAAASAICAAGRAACAATGTRSSRLDAAARRALGISYCPQERPVFDDLTVRDNLTLMRRDRAARAVRALFRALPDPGAPRSSQHAGTLSGGEKKILSLVRGLAEEQPVAAARRAERGRAVGEHRGTWRR